MIAEILDNLSEDNSKCYLCRISLKEYIENLSNDYKDYEVQREIVSNVYLDNLVDTVLKRNHIPPIVLIAENEPLGNEIFVINKFKILDGLQRTYRLNLIWKTIKLFKEALSTGNEILNLNRLSLARKYSNHLQDIDSTSKIFQSIIDYYKRCIVLNPNYNIDDAFNLNNQWFEVWTGLTPDQEVNKMLVLNAGHKPVKIKHQLELIFRNLLPLFSKIDDVQFTVVREKQTSATQFSKNRTLGQFHFSHLISSLLSLQKGKAVTTNSALIQELQNSDFDPDGDSIYFSFSFIKNFITTLVMLDKALYREYKEEGLKWFGREVTLVGIFGAIGSITKEKNHDPTIGLTALTDIFIPNISKLNLVAFESVRNQQDLAKINIGNVNKNAVFDAVVDLLNGKIKSTIEWSQYFKSGVAK